MPASLVDRLHNLPDLLHRDRSPPRSEDNSVDKSSKSSTSAFSKRKSSGAMSPAEQFAAENRQPLGNGGDGTSLSHKPSGEATPHAQQKDFDFANAPATVPVARPMPDHGAEDEGDDDASLDDGMSGQSTAASTLANREGRSQQKWRKYFGDDLEADEDLIVKYNCALQESLLVSGILWISQKHLCFSCNLPGLRRRRVVSVSAITAIRKHVTFKVADNGIEIGVGNETLIFASLVSRDAAYDLITRMWGQAAPETSKDFHAAQAEKSKDSKDATGGDTQARGATQCGSEPFSEVCLDIRLPTTPDKAFHLLWKDPNFLKNWWAETMKLSDIEMGEWQGDDLKKRTSSYIKPLNNSVGPSKTKCDLTDEELKADSETYYEVLTITKTPDVPAGDSFEVQTKTAIAWAGGSKGGARVLVTTQCEWSGRSMLKSTITKASIDGQQTYHKELAKSVRAYIKEHADEYASEDIVDAEQDDELDAGPKPSMTERFMSGLTDPEDPVKLLLMVISAVLLLSNLYLIFFRGGSSNGSSQKVRAPVLDDPELSARVERLEMAFQALKGSLQTL